MKLLRRIIGLTVTLAVLMALAVPRAAASDGYTYTVRIYAGQQGTIVSTGSNEGRISGNGDMLICENVPYINNRIIFHNNMVSLNDESKYYVKGIRESGKGTEEVSETGSGQRVAAFTVDKDQDYVVAYGVLTNPVAYTVNYQTAAGRELAPSETYYGNIGDRPVIAYQYIEGYQPQAYNLTKTLSKDPAENVFTFIYSPRPGTRAAEMPDPVTHDEKTRWFAELLKVQEEVAGTIGQKLLGSRQRVLVEDRDGKTGLLSGRTAGSLTVLFPGEDSLIGEYAHVTVTEARGVSLRGRISE